MTPPTAAEQDSALAAISGTLTEATPESDLDRNLLRLRMIGTAKAAGVSWNTIGRIYGMSGKEAKRQAKQLGARTQRDYVTSLRDEPGPVPVPHNAATAAVRRIHAAEGVTLVPAKPRLAPRRKKPHHVRRRGR